MDACLCGSTACGWKWKLLMEKLPYRVAEIYRKIMGEEVSFFTVLSSSQCSVHLDIRDYKKPKTLLYLMEPSAVCKTSVKDNSDFPTMFNDKHYFAPDLSTHFHVPHVGAY